MLLNKLILVLLSDTSQIRLTLAITSLVLSMGLTFAPTTDQNYALVNQYGTKYLWATLFLLHAFQLFYSVVNKLTFRLARQILAVNGIVLWGFIAGSFLIIAPANTSTEWLLMLPVILELWLLVQTTKSKDL